jgi:uncharacterized membrane protein
MVKQMKKIFFVGLLACTFALASYPMALQAQPGNYGGYGYGPGRGGGYGYGPGRGGGYGYGPGGGGGWGMGPGMMWGGGWIDIPSKLPSPKSAEWVQRLRDILVIEKESLAQYESDADKYDAYMPYGMVIPQEENHIDWLEQLFGAYGLPPDGKLPQIIQTKSLTQAFELAVKLEAELLPKYEWLVKNAEDQDTAGVLDTILLQSRWHWAMFQHALAWAPGYGQGKYGRGQGRGGYGWGMGPGMFGPWGGYGYMRHVIWIASLIILAAIIIIIIFAVRSRRAGGGRRETPLERLQKRYARGEITKEKFDAKKKKLE